MLSAISLPSGIFWLGAYDIILEVIHLSLNTTFQRKVFHVTMKITTLFAGIIDQNLVRTQSTSRAAPTHFPNLFV